jgi:hypothetical protein
MSATVVLASLRGSTYRSVHLAPSFAAALLDGPSEHPARGSPVLLDVWSSEVPACLESFPATC